MKSFSQLLSQAWWTVFRDQKTFWTLFLLANGAGIMVMVIFYALGYDVSDWVNWKPIRQESIPYGIFMAATTILWGFFWFIWMLYLGRLFTAKKIKLASVFPEWTRIFSYIWTIICVILCYIAVWAMVAIVFGITFWMGYVLHVSTGSFSPELAMAAYIFAGTLAFLIVVATMVMALWISVSLNAFSTPAFFLDNHKYFQAPLTSKRIITGRWWKTIGNLLLASIVIMIVPLVVGGVQAVVPTSDIVSSLITSVINGVAGILLIAFIFSLYIDYRDHPLLVVKKSLPKKTKTTKQKKK